MNRAYSQCLKVTKSLEQKTRIIFQTVGESETRRRDIPMPNLLLGISHYWGLQKFVVKCVVVSGDAVLFPVI